MSPEELLDHLKRDQEAVLQDLFDDRLCTKTAAQKLAAITIPQPPPDQDDDEEDEDDTMAHIEGMWRIIIGSLEAHPEHTKSVCDLIIYISQLSPALTQSGQQLCDGQPPRYVWEDTPRLGVSLRDEWNGIESPQQGVKIKRFTAVNALIGHLMLYDERKFNYALFALWTMRNALEYPLPNSDEQRQRIRFLYCIPAAVRLIEVAGQLVRSWDHEFDHSALKSPGQGGPLWIGKHGFCRERWDFWHRRFVELSSEDWLDEEYRYSAKRAADIMAGIAVA